MDWRDYAYVVWVVNQAISNFKDLGMNGIFNANAFYPNQNILLFSDLLWPQAIITAFYSLFTKNIILQFNLMFFTTLYLNIISIYLFWKEIFKKKNSIFFSSIITSFSPFLFLQLDHFQMISYWPFFIAISYLFKNNKSFKKYLFIGIFLSIQFYASVYWSIFLITIIGIFYLIKLIKKDHFLTNIKSLLIIVSTFQILVGPVAFKYIQVKKAYEINRNYSEYVNYSAQISDYFFNGSYHSVISNSVVFKKINEFNNRGAGEIAGSPSLIVLTLFLIGLIAIEIKKKALLLKFSLKKSNVFFLFLTVIGFIFSLGPRLLFNGNYLALPLPFEIALKYLIIYDPIRATARFSALFFIGAIYFATTGLEKIIRFKISNLLSSNFFIFILLILYLLELIPTNLKSEYNDYYSESYELFENDCKQGAVLLEYPFNQNSLESNVATNLKYKASQLSASVRSKCKLVNGYAGFDPADYIYYTTIFDESITATDSTKLKNTIFQKNVSIVKVNKIYLSKDSMDKINNIKLGEDFGNVLLNNDSYLIIKINANEQK